VDRLSPARAGELLRAAEGMRVLVVGDVMLDRYVSGRVERMSPEAPVPVVRVERETHGLGGAANVAANVAALGARCRVVGCVGDDLAGERVRAELERLGVLANALVVATDRPTTVKTRVLARGQQVVRFDEEVTDRLPPELAEAVASAASSQAAHSDVLVMEDYDKGVLGPAVIRSMVAAGERGGIPSVADPKHRGFFDYAGVWLLKPNAKELEDALGARILPDEPDWMETQRTRLGCHNLLVTLGERGMALQTHEGRHVRVPAVARAVFDVSGAGDTVTAVAALALAAGAGPAEAAALANHAAAVEVEKAGGASVPPAESGARAPPHDRRS
jgi:D-beta-D-heptose 7-phosphate kinase/D-beta-D-heptose 1-phosphate adenosyltransferase